MWLIPDTTALFSDPLLKSTPWIVIGRLGENEELAVLAPEVVVREMVNHRRTHASEAVEAYHSASQRLRGLGVETESLSVTAEELTDAYEQQLRERLEELGSIDPVPEISQNALVDRAVKKQKPFGKEGTGYRDALIFESIIRAAESDDVVFITNNHSDFCASRDLLPDGTRAVHSDLIALVKSRGVDQANIRIFPDITSFLRADVTDDPVRWLLENAGDVGAQLLDAVAERHEDALFDAVEKYLYDAWPELGVEVMTPHNVEDMVVDDVSDIGELSLESAKTEDGVVVLGVLGIRATLTVDFSVAAYIEHDRVPYQRYKESTRVEVKSSVSWNLDSDEFEVSELEGPFGGYIEVLD